MVPGERRMGVVLGVRGLQDWMRWRMALPFVPRNGEIGGLNGADGRLMGLERGDVKRSEMEREKQSSRGLATGVVEFFSSCGMCSESAMAAR